MSPVEIIADYLGVDEGPVRNALAEVVAEGWHIVRGDHVQAVDFLGSHAEHITIHEEWKP